MGFLPRCHPGSESDNDRDFVIAQPTNLSSIGKIRRRMRAPLNSRSTGKTIASGSSVASSPLMLTNPRWLNWRSTTRARAIANRSRLYRCQTDFVPGRAARDRSSRTPRPTYGMIATPIARKVTTAPARSQPVTGLIWVTLSGSPPVRSDSGGIRPVTPTRNLATNGAAAAAAAATNSDWPR